MTELLGLEHVGLKPSGATLSLSVRPGQLVAVAGPGGSGKSRLLRVMSGDERPGQGRVHLRVKASVASSEGLTRRTRVQSIPRGSVQVVTELLSTLGLWDARQSTYGDLTPSCRAACELIAPLQDEAPLVLLDGQLDLLDPWTFGAVMEMVRTLRARGRTFIVATHRPDVVAACDGLVVLREEQVRFAGTVEDLLRAGPPHTLEVETLDQEGVRALVSPFEISVRAEGDTVRLEAREGQALAARLLLEGYGDIKYVVMRAPTVEEALRRL